MVQVEFYSWHKSPSTQKMERQLLSYMYSLGGVNFQDRAISDQNLEIALHSGFVTKRPKLPKQKFAHGAILCGNEIVITSGISDLMLNMGLRPVPIGEQDCYSYNIFDCTWKQLPDVPIGKLHPTLIVVNSRFVF